VSSVSQVGAQDAPIQAPLMLEEADEEVVAEPGHMHHPELKPPTVTDIRAFLSAHASYILPEFDKVVKANDEEHIAWMMKDISGIMYEHKALVAFDPKVAALFTSVLKLENDLHHNIEGKLESGEKPEATGAAIKDQLKQLITQRIELEKGQIAFKKSQLNAQLKELEVSSQKVDEITEKELKAIILELQQSQEEGDEF